MNLKQLIEQRLKKIADARAISDKYPDGAITGDEKVAYDKLLEEARALGERIDREHELVEEQRKAAEAEYRNRHADPGGAGPTGDEPPSGTPEARLAEMRGKRATELRQFLAAGRTGQFEMRALQVDSDVEGGNLTGPETFVEQLIKDIDNQVHVRSRATIHSVPRGGSLGVPTLDTDVGDADWTVELGTGSEDDDMRIGKRELKPNPLAKRVKISKTLVAASGINADSLVRERLAYKFGVTQEKGFLLGSGAGQPLGAFVASNDGVPTSRDVSDGNTATEITWLGLQNAKYSIKAVYWPRLRWMLHRDAVKQIASKRDGDGRFLWEPSHKAGEPDTILGLPFDVSEYAPNTFTANQYVGLLADWSKYWIADSMEMSLQQLLELYAETNQNGYIGRLETDGMPVLAEAFARVKLGS